MSIDIKNETLDEKSELLYKILGYSLKGFPVLVDEHSLVCETKYFTILDRFLQKVLVDCQGDSRLNEVENISQRISQTVNEMLKNNIVSTDIHVLNWIKKNDIPLLQETVNYISKTGINHMINDYLKAGLANYIHIEQMVDGFSNPIVVSLLITTTIPLKRLRREINISYVSSNNLPVRPINTLPDADNMFHDWFSNPQEPMNTHIPNRDINIPSMDGFNSMSRSNSYHQEHIDTPQRNTFGPSRASSNSRPETTDKQNINIDAVFGDAVLKYFLITNPEVGELRELNEKEINSALSLLKYGIEFKDGNLIYDKTPRLNDLLINMLINRWFLPSSKDIVDKLFILDATINKSISSDASFKAIITYVGSMLTTCTSDTVSLMNNVIKSFLDDLTSN